MENISFMILMVINLLLLLLLYLHLTNKNIKMNALVETGEDWVEIRRDISRGILNEKTGFYSHVKVSTKTEFELISVRKELKKELKSTLLQFRDLKNMLNETKTRLYKEINNTKEELKPIQKLNKLRTNVYNSLGKNISKTIQLELRRSNKRLNETKTGFDSLERHILQSLRPIDCSDIFAYKGGMASDGVYLVYPNQNNETIEVYCDMSTDGGGWTLFQRRFDGSVDFSVDWNTYKNGFGNVSGEYWLGTDKIFALSNQKQYELRIDIEDKDGGKGYTVYDSFAISSEADGYSLKIGSHSQLHSGTAGDSLTFHQGSKFSTKKQNGLLNNTCTARQNGGWWFKRCDESNLNGLYTRTGSRGTGRTLPGCMFWWRYKGYECLQRTEMKIRPAGFKALLG